MLGSNEAFEVTVPTAFGDANIFHAMDPYGDTVRILEIGGTYESATYLDHRYCELAFEYTKLFNRIFEMGRIPSRVLMLGGGGFSWPKYLIAHFPQVKVDVVEIDPSIISIAHDYFGLTQLEQQYHPQRDGRLRIFCEDALDHLMKSDEKYDLIVNDCFVGRDAPDKLADLRAANLYRDHLAPGGVFFANVVAARMGRGSRKLRSLVKVLLQRFEYVGVVPLGSDELRVPDNNLVVASDEAFSLRDEWKIEWLLD